MSQIVATCFVQAAVGDRQRCRYFYFNLSRSTPSCPSVLLPSISLSVPSFFSLGLVPCSVIYDCDRSRSGQELRRPRAVLWVLNLFAVFFKYQYEQHPRSLPSTSFNVFSSHDSGGFPTFRCPPKHLPCDPVFFTDYLFLSPLLSYGGQAS